MYNDFFGFERAPFNNTPDPTFFYQSKSHREAMATMVYGVEQGKGFVMVTGDVGMGKTMLSQALKQALGEDFVVIEIANPWSSPEEVLSAIRLCVNVQGPENNALFDGLRDRLLNLRQQGKRVVIVIDEAHQMSERMIEGIRLLSNVETTTEKLLQIIFIGQNELAEMLSRHSMRQIQQRLFLSRHLEAFSDSETIEYIRHRVKIAGGKEEVFDEAALRLIARESSGTPRVINQLCDNALLFAMGRNQHLVRQEDVKEALQLLRPWQQARTLSSPPPSVVASAPTRGAETPVQKPAKSNPLPFSVPLDEQGMPRNEPSRQSNLPFSLPFDDAPESTTTLKSAFKLPEPPVFVTPPKLRLSPTWLAIGGLTLALAGGGYFWWTQGSKHNSVSAAPPSPPAVSAPAVAPANVALPAPSAAMPGESVRLSLATSLRISGDEAVSAPAPINNPPPPVVQAATLPLPQASQTRIVTLPREGGVSRIAAETFGLWNESARDLVHSVNPEITTSLDQIAGGSFLKMPMLSRESLIVDTGSGGTFIYYGTFASADEAQAELVGLRRIWPNSQIQQVNRQGSTIHRIFIGNFSSRADALKGLESLWFKHLPALN